MMLGIAISGVACGIPIALNIPKLSAAMTTPSLNLTPSTDVPVTAGDCVCVLGMACEYEASSGL